MTQKECKAKLELLMTQIADTLTEYDSDGKGFSAFWQGRNIMFFNDYDFNDEKRIDFMIQYNGRKK